MCSRGVSAPLALVALALAGCASVPEPQGAHGTTDHYEIRADRLDLAAVVSAGVAAERYHVVLQGFFGAKLTENLPVIVCTSPRRFAQYWQATTVSPPPIGFYSCSPCYAVITGFRDPAEQVLAHELVHHFVHHFLPEAPYWIDEGLACELSHTHDAHFDERNDKTFVLENGIFYDGKDWKNRRVYRHELVVGRGLVWVAGESPFPEELARRLHDCPLAEVYTLTDGRIRELARSLAGWTEDDVGRDEWARTQVAAALVRFGMETRSWTDLRQAARFEPDVSEFLAWLRASPTHARFPALVGPSVETSR